MKKIKMLLVGIIIGLLLGLWFGVNIGRDVALFSNPFNSHSIKVKIKETSESLIQKSGDALENSGKAIKDSIKN
jgi:gas vesicle protein